MPDQNSTFHVPVLLAPILAAASGARRAVDATLGDGGHAARAAGARARSARDRSGSGRLGRQPGSPGRPDRIQYLQAPYASPEALAAVAAFGPDFILLDLGVSSRQLDEEARGFTFRPGAPLDMRMGRTGTSAADLLNSLGRANAGGVVPGLRRRAAGPPPGL